MFKNTASQKIRVYAFDYSTGAPKTGDAANITVYVSKDYAAVAALTDTSATELSSTNAPGWYEFDVSQTESNADDLHFTGKSSTANVVVVGQHIRTLPAGFTGLGISGGAITTVTNLTNAPTSGDLTATMKTSVATAALTTQVTEAYRADGAAPTLAQALCELLAHFGEKSISSTTLTLKKFDGSTTAATFTLNDATTPTSITRAT